MKAIIFITCFLFSVFASGAEPFKVAILDTGFTPLPMDDSAMKLCDKGHYDFNAEEATVGEDEHGHGSYVTYLVNKNARTKNICFLVYKVFGSSVLNEHLAIDSALQRAFKAKARAINMSLYMKTYSHRTRGIIKYITRRGTKVFVPSGNEAHDLNKRCFTYPVCFKGINKNLVVVGSLDVYGGIASYSNYGARVDVYEMGDMDRSRGTSFAVPRALGKYIWSLKLDKRK